MTCEPKNRTERKSALFMMYRLGGIAFESGCIDVTIKLKSTLRAMVFATVWYLKYSEFLGTYYSFNRIVIKKYNS